ncbi:MULTISPECIES: hypothetical protein [unclassified Streptomyces]|uniref:hypothetical protein n=1 Tax=unclassified Streptomyces TaxID=2593676 RepID=UPI00068F3CFB|nr:MULTISPECIES: hypothetical protein [unclassified Streptomyces]MCH0560377.1 hypothetical protein [Streptomyces sp. MUM 16J]
MNTISRPTAGLATENFDAETLALLEAVEVPLPAFTDLDLDVAFGTPLEMHEFVTPCELARWDAASSLKKGRKAAQAQVAHDFAARRAAAEDILATDPSITELVRERLVDALIPHAAQLRTAPPATAAEPLPLAA